MNILTRLYRSVFPQKPEPLAMKDFKLMAIAEKRDRIEGRYLAAKLKLIQDKESKS